MKFSAVWSSLENRNFRFVWISAALSHSGNWAYLVGVGWLLQTLSQSPFWVGFSLFASLFPVVVIGPYAGVLADRFNRRKIYTLAQMLSAGAAGLQLAVNLAGEPPLWLVVACSLCFGVAFNIQMVMAASMVPVILDYDKLHNGASLMGVVSHGAEFFGAVLATPLIAFLGPESVFALVTVLYVAAAFFSSRVKIREDYLIAPRSGKDSVMRSLANGFAYIRSRPIGLLILLVGLHCALTMSYNGLLPSYASEYIQPAQGAQDVHGDHANHAAASVSGASGAHAHGGASSAGGGLYGSIMTAVGLGALLGNLSSAGVSSGRFQRWIYGASAIGSGLSLCLLFLARSQGLALASALLVGATQAVFMASSNAFVMQRTDPGYQGRVSSVYVIIAAGMMAVCNLAYGSLGTFMHPSVLMIAAGLAFALLFAAIGLMSSLRSILRSPEARSESLAS
jgi:hypothetical protein